MIAFDLGIKRFNKSIPVSRRFFTVEVKKYLQETKGLEETVAQGIINAFPRGRVSMADIKALGDVGLKALSESVEREIDSRKHMVGKGSIDITVAVPHHGVSFNLTVPNNTTFFELARQNEDISQYMECACSGIAACSTCHVIVDPSQFDALPEAEEAELDMLDLAWGVTDTSRLGCQLRFTPEIHGLKVSLPEQTQNLF
mmetsp:Transcript_1570/g.2597  ORF Transcript_1570/g.2597 Transcript_1570/m.2597 type:complete len:200 (+) Transcript_1570:29-628(+)